LAVLIAKVIVLHAFAIDEKYSVEDAAIEAIVAVDKLIVIEGVGKPIVILVIVVPGAIPVPVTYIPAEYILVPAALLNIKIEVAPLVTAVAPTVPEKVPVAPSVLEVNCPIEDPVNGVLEFTSGSTIVILPPVKFKLDVSILKMEPPKPTLVATFPLSFPSTIIVPAV
jgi:hypothetical protein